MKEKIMLKLKESLVAVLPIGLIVTGLGLTLVTIPLSSFVVFIVGAILLIVGMVFFTLGADISMMAVGELMGSQITRSRNVPFISFICFLLGFMITIAEPDLRVLADTVSIIDSRLLIFAVAAGVGCFLVLSFFRVYLQFKLSYILIIMYGLLILLALSPLIPSAFVAVAFDSGGVTTGPITVPFIMALGVGLASVRGDKTSEEDSFGLVALCSIGPILTVLILGAFHDTSQLTSTTSKTIIYENIEAILVAYGCALKLYAHEVILALLPIFLFFIIFNLFSLKLDKKAFIRICIGMLYTYIGLVLFLAGVNTGFVTIGYLIGEQIAKSTYCWLLIPLGAVMGYFIVAAEPAVLVLMQQVEEITSGYITGKALKNSLAIGVSCSVALAMVRVLTGLSIWYILLPGYLFSLVMTFFVPPLFTSIAFDSGGVASGPMTAAFLLPLAMGACQARGGNLLTDAFGIVAFVAMTPLVTIQLLGAVSQFKAAQAAKKLPPLSAIMLSDEMIEYSLDEEVLSWQNPCE